MKEIFIEVCRVFFAQNFNVNDKITPRFRHHVEDNTFFDLRKLSWYPVHLSPLTHVNRKLRMNALFHRRYVFGKLRPSVKDLKGKVLWKYIYCFS